MYDIHDFATAVKKSETYKSSEGYKKLILNRLSFIRQIYPYYHQGFNFCIGNLRKNKNISASTLELLVEILKSQNIPENESEKM